MFAIILSSPFADLMIWGTHYSWEKDVFRKTWRKIFEKGLRSNEAALN